MIAALASAASGSFKTLAAALQAADLVGTLKGKGPFTVFAPTDEAFAKLPAAKTVNGASLTIHAMGGNVMVDNATVTKTERTHATSGSASRSSHLYGAVARRVPFRADPAHDRGEHDQGDSPAD